MSPSWTGRWPGCPPVDTDPQVRFLHACRAYLVKDWEQLVRHTEPLIDDPMLGIEAGLFGGMARVRLEMYGQAEPLLSAALMRCRSEQPQRKELRYWLARAHEGTGRSAAALPLYRAVHRVDPAFMDTSARLAAIAEGDGLRRGRPTWPRSQPGRASARTADGRTARRDARPGLLTATGDGREPWPGGTDARTWPAAPVRPRPGADDGRRARRRSIPVRPGPPQLPAGPRRPGAAGGGAGRAGADGRPGAGQAAGARRSRRS